MGKSLGVIHFEAKFLSICGSVKLKPDYLFPKYNGGQAQDRRYRYSHSKKEKDERKREQRTEGQEKEMREERKKESHWFQAISRFTSANSLDLKAQK